MRKIVVGLVLGMAVTLIAIAAAIASHGGYSFFYDVGQVGQLSQDERLIYLAGAVDALALESTAGGNLDNCLNHILLRDRGATLGDIDRALVSRLGVVRDPSGAAVEVVRRTVLTMCGMAP